MVVHNGFPILIIDIFELTATFMIVGLKGEKKINAIVGILKTIIFSYGISIAFYNYQIFIFFLISLISKSLFILSLGDTKKEINISAIMMGALIISAFLALLFS